VWHPDWRRDGREPKPLTRPLEAATLPHPSTLLRVKGGGVKIPERFGRFAGIVRAEAGNDMFRQRIRLRYSIGGDKRFLSHHDLMRLWLRALRRAELPLRLSEGFHVRPKVSFALAKSVGIASASEWFEFELADWVNPEEVYRALAPRLPEGLAIVELSVVSPGDRAVAVRAVYAAELQNLPEDIDERIAGLLARTEIVVARGDPESPRHVNIRPMLESLQHDGARLVITSRCKNEGALKPEEVLRELGLAGEEIARGLITRTELALAS